jgi:hypothetical protein
LRGGSVRQVYNPYKDIGYSMELFLETNIDPARPMFLCGGWYHDEIPPQQGGGIPGFKTWAVGACDRIRHPPDSARARRPAGSHIPHKLPHFRSWSGGLAHRREEEPPSLAEWILEAEALAPTYTPPDAGKYPEDTWERVTLTGVRPGPAPWLPRAGGCVRAAMSLAWMWAGR